MKYAVIWGKRRRGSKIKVGLKLYYKYECGVHKKK